MRRGTHFRSRQRSTILTTFVRIVHEENRKKKLFVLWMADFLQRQLEWTLGILGIQVPDYV